MDDIVWTNDGWLFDELGLEGKKIFLWKIWLRTPEMLSVPGQDFDYDWDRTCLEKMPGWQQAEKIWLIDTEGRSYNSFLDDPRVHIWDSTMFEHERMHQYWFWLDWVREVESWKMSVDKINSHQNKKPEFVFDLLLGKRKSTRTRVFDAVDNDPLLKPITLMSYTGKGTHWIPGIEVDRADDLPVDFKGPLFYNPDNASNSIEAHQVTFHDRQTANLCCFVPWKLYNNTWYTMLVETHQTSYTFLSEKIAKPLISRRIFVAVHSFPGTLSVLKKLGFQTFSDVIDESYDTIDDFDLRLSAALEQCRKLSQLDPIEVYEKMQSVLEHNRNHLMAMDEADRMIREMKNMIGNTTTEI